MVDRLEELLAMLEEEDEGEEEREDVLALKGRTAAVRAPEEDGGEAAVPAGAKSRERRDAPMKPMAERPDRNAAGRVVEAGGLDDVEEPGRDGPGSAEEPPDGPVWRLSSRAVQEAEAVWRQELSERLDRMDGAVAEAVRPAAERVAETVGESLRAEQARDGELARASGRETGSGLESLYRQALQASRPAPQAVPVEQAGRTFYAEEPGRTAALTVEELDRAVRRDSRRYDGGMTIF